MPKQALHPACLISIPAAVNILSKPSALICLATSCEPGTIKVFTEAFFCFPLIILATNLKSSMRELVQEPINTFCTGIPNKLWPASKPI